MNKPKQLYVEIYQTEKLIPESLLIEGDEKISFSVTPPFSSAVSGELSTGFELFTFLGDSAITILGVFTSFFAGTLEGIE